MKASVGFIFFMLFLAGYAFVNLRNMSEQGDNVIVSTETLMASPWRPERLGEMNVDADTEMLIEFKADGQVVGNGGCNRFFGQYKIVDGDLAVSEIGSSRMACPEPSMSFEISLLEALGSVASASINGSRLSLKNNSGNTVLRLVPAIESQEN